MSKVPAILDLLGQGIIDRAIADRVGVAESYVRAVRSRYTAKSPEAFWRRTKGTLRPGRAPSGTAPTMFLPPRPRANRKSQPSGQSREELRVLAETLYRWRTEGREAR